jgi:DNA-3-methyladenine glycosylase II
MNNDDMLLCLAQDAKLAPLLTMIELPEWPEQQTDVYATLLDSITSQQLSVKAAATIHQRFLDLFEDHYPDPNILIDLSPETLRQVGLSGQKSQYLRNTAAFFLENNLMQYNWKQHTEEEIVQLLTQIKGVGRWTVEMILMFSLHFPDVFPIDDLGIQQAIIKLYEISPDLKGKPLRKTMTEIAEPWRPYRSYASRYLWKWKGM